MMFPLDAHEESFSHDIECLSSSPHIQRLAPGNLAESEGNFYDDRYRVKMFGGNGNKLLSEQIASSLGVQLTAGQCAAFADGEIKLQLDENVRGSDFYLIQSCNGRTKHRQGNSINDNLMELLLLINTLKLSSCKRITAVIPYLPYSRQDRKTKPRVPISGSAVVQLIEAMGPDRVLTMDLHCGQIQGFFHHTPVDNLYSDKVFRDWLVNKDVDWKNTVIVSPDAGGVERARRFADMMGASGVVTIIKRRLVENEVSSMELMGDVEGKRCVIVDDIIDTAGTLCKAVKTIMDAKAVHVMACITHGVLSGDAIERINSSSLARLIVTDSIDQVENSKVCPKLKVLSVSSVFASAIMKIHNEKSVSSLFSKHR